MNLEKIPVLEPSKYLRYDGDERRFYAEEKVLDEKEIEMILGPHCYTYQPIFHLLDLALRRSAME